MTLSLQSPPTTGFYGMGGDPIGMELVVTTTGPSVAGDTITWTIAPPGRGVYLDQATTQLATNNPGHTGVLCAVNRIYVEPPEISRLPGSRDITINLSSSNAGGDTGTFTLHYKVFIATIRPDKRFAYDTPPRHPLDPTDADTTLTFTLELTDDAVPPDYLGNVPMEISQSPAVAKIYQGAAEQLPDLNGMYQLSTDSSGELQFLMVSPQEALIAVTAIAPGGEAVQAEAIFASLTPGGGKTVPPPIYPVSDNSTIDIPSTTPHFWVTIPDVPNVSPGDSLVLLLNDNIMWTGAYEDARGGISVAYSALKYNTADNLNTSGFFVQKGNAAGAVTSSALTQFRASGTPMTSPDPNAENRTYSIDRMIPYLDNNGTVVNNTSLYVDLGINLKVFSSGPDAVRANSPVTFTVYLNAFIAGTDIPKANIIQLPEHTITAAELAAGSIGVTLDRLNLLGYAGSANGRNGLIEIDYTILDSTSNPAILRRPIRWLKLPLDTVGNGN